MRITLRLILLFLLTACDSQDAPSSSSTDSVPDVMGFNPAQCSYELEGQFVSLHAGHHQQKGEGGAAMQSTTLVQTMPLPVEMTKANYKNLVAVVLAHQSGGASPLHYLAMAYDQDGACTGSNARLLGEQVSIESAVLESATLVRVVGHVLVNDVNKSTTMKHPLEWRFRFEYGELLQE